MKDKSRHWPHPHKLAIFAKVVELQSLTHAAEAMYLTQSGVSNAVRSLEALYGAPMLRMEGKRLCITDSGMAIFKHYQKVSDDYAALSDELHALHAGMRGQISIIMVSTAKYFLPAWMTHFMDRYPGASFRCHIAHRDAIRPALLAQEYQIALMTDPPYEPALQSDRLKTNHLALVASPGHHLCQSRSLVFRDIAPCLFITRERHARITELLYQYYQQHGTEPRVRYEIDSTEAVKEAVKSGAGLALLPLDSVRQDIDGGHLVHLDFDTMAAQLQNEWALVRHRTRFMNQISQVFCRELVADHAG